MRKEWRRVRSGEVEGWVREWGERREWGEEGEGVAGSPRKWGRKKMSGEAMEPARHGMNWRREFGGAEDRRGERPKVGRDVGRRRSIFRVSEGEASGHSSEESGIEGDGDSEVGRSRMEKVE